MIKKIAPVFAILTASIWGVSFSAGKVAYLQLTVFEVVFYRMVISAIFFIPFGIYFFTKRGGVSRQDFIMLVIASILTYPIVLGLQFLGLSYTHASISSIAIGLEGAATMLMAYFILKTKPSRSNIIVAIFSIVGLIIVVGIPDNAKLIGVGVILLANLISGLSIVLKKQLVAKFSPLELTSYLIILGSIPVIVISFFIDAGVTPIWEFRNDVFIAVLILSLGATVLAYYLYSLCLKNLSAVRTAQFIVIEPLVGVIAGVLYLGEPFDYNIGIGTGLVLIAILINSIADD